MAKTDRTNPKHFRKARRTGRRLREDILRAGIHLRKDVLDVDRVPAFIVFGDNEEDYSVAS